MSNSLGITSDAVHMLFDSTAILLGLVATVMSRRPPTPSFPFGYGRIEVVAAFVNAVALVLTSLSITWEGIERLFSPKEIHHENLLLISVIGLFVNIYGIFSFHLDTSDSVIPLHSPVATNVSGGFHSRPRNNHKDKQTPLLSHFPEHEEHDHCHGHHHCGHSHDHLFTGMFLHVLADALGSVSVIISTLAMQYLGWAWTDTVCSLFISFLILISTWPILRATTLILLQHAPEGQEKQLKLLRQKIKGIPGVLHIDILAIWSMNEKTHIAQIKLIVSTQEDDKIRYQVGSMAREYLNVKDVFVHIDRDIQGF